MTGNYSPALPLLPSGFGMDSSYPPMPGSSRITASQPKPSVAPFAVRPVSLPSGPAVPPKEQHHAGTYSYSSSPASQGLRPGQYLTSPQVTAAPFRAPSPQLQPPGSMYHTAVPGQQRVHLPTNPQPPAFSVPAPAHAFNSSHDPRRASNADHSYSASLHPHPGNHYGQHLTDGPRRTSVADPYQNRPAPPPPPPQPERAHTPASYQQHQHQPQPQRASPPSPPGISAPLPDMASLDLNHQRARDDRQRIHWAKQVLQFVERNSMDSTKISEPRLVRWTDEAINIILHNATRLPRPDPEALYLRGDLQASGAFPTYVSKNLKEAFNDFEHSARLGWTPSWFRIGRDYELLGDFPRARDVYELGMQASDVGCIYRLGMAFLLGQLDLSVNFPRAIAMLQDAADKADLDTPQPAYIYGMLLAGEFSHIDIPSNLLRSSAPGQTLEGEARRRIERAAYLNFAPAQFKCGWLYEYAQLECAFDPLLSVQYYSLASQSGETEADMALSKWFLCGSEGCFDKNEGLAFTFAERAAQKGLASAEFALGYYHEVGVGIDPNVAQARTWYQKAASQGNTDAVDRLKALKAPQAAGLSRREHQSVMDNKLVRQRTQARLRSEQSGRSPVNPSASQANGRTMDEMNASTSAPGHHSGGFDLNRTKTMKMVQDTAAGRKRPNYRLGGGNSESMAVSAPPMPVPMPLGSRVTSDTSSRRPSAPATNMRISSGPQASGRHGAGYSLSDAPLPPPPQQAASTMTASQPARPTPSSVAQDHKKTYSTFAEMGIAPKKAGKEDCIIC